MLQERCRPLAQSGVIKAPRVQLENGLLRTKQKPTSLPTLRYDTRSGDRKKVSYPAGRFGLLSISSSPSSGSTPTTIPPGSRIMSASRPPTRGGTQDGDYK